MFESRRHGGFSHRGVVALLGFGRRDVADRLHQPAIVKPVYPSECCEFDGFHGPPRPPPMDEFCLVAIDGFREGIVVAIADAADRWLNAGFRQALGILDREVLGGFKRSSQHSQIGGCNECSRTEIGTVGTSAIAVAGAATGGGA